MRWNKLLLKECVNNIIFLNSIYCHHSNNDKDEVDYWSAWKDLYLNRR